MTRDEALKRMKAVTNVDNTTNDQHYLNFISCLEALGLLTLEESPSILRRAESALRVAIQVGSPEDPMDAVDIIGCLHDAGLKIVEK